MNDDPIPTFNPKQAELAFDSARRDAAISAFPWAAEIYDYGFVISSGLTKRELFAAMVMQGLAASDGFFKDEALKATAMHLGIAGPSTVAKILAKASVEFADALIAELAKDSP